MAIEHAIVPGVVKNGVVVPEGDTQLPDGARVTILLAPPQLTPALQRELAQWEAASDEAWSLIDQWEQP